MTNSPLAENLVENKNTLVPKGLTIGIGIFALLLASAWMGMSVWAGSRIGQDIYSLLPRILLICAFFLVVLPLGFVVGSKALNRYSNKPPIHVRNALTLGLLFTNVAMLWVMSVYS